MCSFLNVDGLRGDIVVNRCAKAHAAYAPLSPPLAPLPPLAPPSKLAAPMNRVDAWARG